MKKHILVISQYFYPEQFRINDICLEWVKKGYKVTVLTGIPNYPEGEFYSGYGWFKKTRENHKGIDIIRIPLIPRGKNPVMLSLNYLSFVVSGFFWQLFTRTKADYVFIFEVSPMTQALPGIWYAQRQQIPCYIYVQDLWPENVQIVAGINNPIILKNIGHMVNYIYAHCQKIFTTSTSFVEAIVNRGVSKEKVEFWPQYAESFYQPVHGASVEEIPQDKKFNVIFTGNIGHAQGLEIVAEAATILKKEQMGDKIRFNIVGEGRYKNELMELVNVSGAADMFNFIQKQPAAKIPEFLGVCDVAFLCLTNDPLFAMTIPAKLQSYMACGCPVVASADGEVARIINEAKCGFISPSGDAKSLAKNLITLVNSSPSTLQEMGLNSRQYYIENFEKNKLLSLMDKYFDISQ